MNRLKWFLICCLGRLREAIEWHLKHRRCRCGAMCEANESQCDLCQMAPILQVEHLRWLKEE